MTAIDEGDVAARPEDLAAEIRPLLHRLGTAAPVTRPEVGLSRSRMSVLGALAEYGALRIGEIARLENVKVPTASNRVSALEDAGLVERCGEPGDRRAVCARLTAAGEKVAGGARAAEADALARRLSRLDDDQLAALAGAAGALRALAAHQK